MKHHSGDEWQGSRSRKMGSNGGGGRPGGGGGEDLGAFDPANIFASKDENSDGEEIAGRFNGVFRRGKVVQSITPTVTTDACP